jgi:hypothetical protein
VGYLLILADIWEAGSGEPSPLLYDLLELIASAISFAVSDLLLLFKTLIIAS